MVEVLGRKFMNTTGWVCIVTVMAAIMVCYQQSALAGKWLSLEQDGLHDTNNPGLKFLQSPAEALTPLPRENAGNKVDWQRAMEQGLINPRSSLRGGKELKILDLDILMKDTRDALAVVFPHKIHTQWLDCENCHEKLFKYQTGASVISMADILNGESCGVCHGAVAFPVTECDRCHKGPRDRSSS